MDKLQLRGQNHCQVFNPKSGCSNVILVLFYAAKRSILKLKILP
jgi:hypothetical protein